MSWTISCKRLVSTLTPNESDGIGSRSEMNLGLHLAAPEDRSPLDSTDPRSIGTSEFDQLLRFRRDLHAHPELKFEEYRTSRKVIAFLEALNLPIRSGLAGTGVVATIFGRGRSATNPGKAIGLRADMDALPVKELNTFTHASVCDGVMHACGHDGHMAMLLGAAARLSMNRAFDGTVHLIFQPGEEGGAGARRMIEEGLFDEFPCEAVFALHNWPELPVGHMGVRVGSIMAAARRFEIRVSGRGGHAAQPHASIDPIPVACAIVSQLQLLVSRCIDPLEGAVLTVGKIEAGTSFNVIPETAVIQGTSRALSPEVSATMVRGIENIAVHTAAAHGAEVGVSIYDGYPATRNDHDAAMLMGRVMQFVVGVDRAHLDVKPSMAAEDFSFMLEHVPGAYGFIGNGADGAGLHSPAYDFNDGNLAIGPQFWEQLVMAWFDENAGERSPVRVGPEFAPG